MDFPIPRDAPVMMATFPSSNPMIFSVMCA